MKKSGKWQKITTIILLPIIVPLWILGWFLVYFSSPRSKLRNEQKMIQSSQKILMEDEQEQSEPMIVA